MIIDKKNIEKSKNNIRYNVFFPYCIDTNFIVDLKEVNFTVFMSVTDDREIWNFGDAVFNIESLKFLHVTNIFEWLETTQKEQKVTFSFLKKVFYHIYMINTFFKYLPQVLQTSPTLKEAKNLNFKYYPCAYYEELQIFFQLENANIIPLLVLQHLFALEDLLPAKPFAEKPVVNININKQMTEIDKRFMNYENNERKQIREQTVFSKSEMKKFIMDIRRRVWNSYLAYNISPKGLNDMLHNLLIKNQKQMTEFNILLQKDYHKIQYRITHFEPFFIDEEHNIKLNFSYAHYKLIQNLFFKGERIILSFSQHYFLRINNFPQSVRNDYFQGLGPNFNIFEFQKKIENQKVNYKKKYEQKNIEKKIIKNIKNLKIK